MIDVDVRVVDGSHLVMTVTNSCVSESRVEDGDALFVPFKSKQSHDRPTPSSHASSLAAWVGLTSDSGHIQHMTHIWQQHRPSQQDIIGESVPSAVTALSIPVQPEHTVRTHKTSPPVRRLSSTQSKFGADGTSGSISPRLGSNGRPVTTSTGLGLPLSRSFAIAGGGWAGIAEMPYVRTSPVGYADAAVGMRRTSSLTERTRSLFTRSPVRVMNGNAVSSGVAAGMTPDGRHSARSVGSHGVGTGSLDCAAFTQFWAVLSVEDVTDQHRSEGKDGLRAQSTPRRQPQLRQAGVSGRDDVCVVDVAMGEEKQANACNGGGVGLGDESRDGTTASQNCVTNPTSGCQ